MKTEKILSFIIALLIPFPLMITGIASTVEKISPAAVLGGIAGGLIALCLGLLAGGLLKKATKKLIYFVRALSVIIGAMVAAVCEIIIFSLELGALAPVFLPLAYVFWYWFGFRAGSGQKLVPPMVLGAYAVEAAFMFPICRSFNPRAAVPIIAVTAFLTVTGALLINFRQVSGLSLRGKSENRLLTKACARFNVKATLIFCSILLFAFFFCEVGAKWLFEAIKAFFRFLVYLMSLFYFMLGKNDDYDPPEYENPFISVTENSSLLDRALIWAIIIALAVIFFKPAVKALKSLYRYIMERLGKEAAKTEELRYTDIYQESGGAGARENSFKKAYKAFLKEKSPEKRFRLGYKAFMAGLREREVELAPSDTPENILEKGREFASGGDLDLITEKYIGVRYGDITPEKEDCDAMRELLRGIGRLTKPKNGI